MTASTVTHSELISKPSKSARKREYQALQVLGEQLIELTTSQLHSIGLPEALLDAVLAAKSMSAHGAMRRQKQLIGKIMRDVDAEPIRAAMDAYGNNDRVMKQIFRDAEIWRERLTRDSGNDLVVFFDLIGHRNEKLVDAIASWSSAPGDDARRLEKRKIFREIHKELISKMQNIGSSIYNCLIPVRRRKLEMSAQIGIIMGSLSDWDTMRHASETLETLGVAHDVRVVSAHRTPDLLFEYAATAVDRGLKVIIAGAGGAAHLPGMAASKTRVPVLGVPIQTQALSGMDSLLSIVQMPAGIPVGTMAIGKAGAINAALLAAAILANVDADVATALQRFRRDQTDKVLGDSDLGQQ